MEPIKITEVKKIKSIRSNFFENTFDEISGDKSRMVFHVTNKNIFIQMVWLLSIYFKAG